MISELGRSSNRKSVISFSTIFETREPVLVKLNVKLQMIHKMASKCEQYSTSFVTRHFFLNSWTMFRRNNFYSCMFFFIFIIKESNRDGILTESFNNSEEKWLNCLLFLCVSVHTILWKSKDV